MRGAAVEFVLNQLVGARVELGIPHATELGKVLRYAMRNSRSEVF
jgi:hypothetical protein